MRVDRFIAQYAIVSSLAFAILTYAAAGSKADITIVGGSSQQREEIWNTYNNLPRCCRDAARVSVQVFSNGDMDAYIKAGDPAEAQRVNLSAIDGIYQNALPTITLRAATAAQDVSSAFAHEYGHYIWQRHLSKTNRSDYARLYEAQKKSHCLVSAYAAVSVEEGFAEAFCFYVMQRPILSARDSLSCCYLDQMMSEPAGPGSSRPGM